MVDTRSSNRPCSISVSSICSLIGGISNTALAPTLRLYPSGNGGRDSVIGVQCKLAEKVATMLRRRFKWVREQFFRLINEYCDDDEE